MHYQADLQQAEKNKVKYQTIIKRIKKTTPKHLDVNFKESHESVFSQVDCLLCANCCKTTSPLFLDADIDRLARYLKMKFVDFQHQYLKKDEDGDWVLKNSPCPFLAENNTCNVYDLRPKACREYPHTNRKKMYQVMDITYKNVFICPAVSKILDLVAEKIQF